MAALLVAALILLPQDPRVDATLSARSVTVGDAVVYQIIVEARDAAPTRVGTPEMPGAFEVLRTQDFSETQLSFPGGRARRFRREVVLLAQHPGTYTIPSTQVELGGRVYHTPELQLAVTGAVVQREAPSGRPRLRVEFVPDTVYVGQQALLRAEALIPDGRRPRRARRPSFEPPQTGGFWTQELPMPRQSSIRLIGPEVFEVHSFERAYFALAAGDRVLDPATVLYEVRLDWLSGTRVERLSSDSLRLAVRPLPDTGRPPAFRGAVGKFALTASLDRDRVRAGDAATLLIEVRGEGNVKGLPAPDLPEIDGAELIAAGDESESWVSDGVLHGTRTFRWMLVPSQGPGVIVPPVEFAFFDPFLERYDVMRTEALELGVDGAAAVPSAGHSAVAPPLALRVSPSPQSLSWVRSPWFLALNATPLLAIAFAVVRRRRRPVRRHLGPAAALRAWQVRSRSRALSAAGLRTAVHRTFADALDIRSARLGNDAALADALRARQVDDTILTDMMALLRRIDEVRFAAAEWDGDTRAALVADADVIVSRVCAALANRPGPGATAKGGPGDAVALACAVLASALISASAVAQQEATGLRHFADGVAAFEAGDYQRAERAFLAHVAASPTDANGWINLGVAREAAGRGGDALPAYLRALRLQPRDAALRSHLDDRNAATAARTFTPPLRLAADEVVLLASALWLLAVTAVFIAVWRRGVSSARAVAAAAAALLLVHAASVQLHRRSTANATVAVAMPTVLRVAPALRSGDRERVAAGTLLRVVERRGEWLRVEHARREGWVDRRDVARP